MSVFIDGARSPGTPVQMTALEEVQHHKASADNLNSPISDGHLNYGISILAKRTLEKLFERLKALYV